MPDTLIHPRFYYTALWLYGYETARLMMGFTGSRWEYWLFVERQIAGEDTKI